MEQVLLERLASGEVPKQHSLEFVQIFLNASIACILYTRRLINWRSTCFLTRNVSQLIPDDFANFDNIHEHFCSAGCEVTDKHNDSQAFKIMQTGHHRCADEILNTLNIGIMDALRNGHLSVMKLFIGGKMEKTSAIVESYTFVFERMADTTVVKTKETDEVFRVEDLQRSFKKAIASLLVSVRDLPSLPKSGRKLSVSLIYRDTCPLLYQPSGFLQADKNQHFLWKDEDDSLQTTRFDTGAYAVSTRLRRHMNESEQDSELSKQIRELQQTSSRDHNLPLTFNALASSKKRKRTTEDQGSSSRRQTSRARSLPGVWPDLQNIEVDDLDGEPEDMVKGKKHRKISRSEKLIHFSSSSQVAVTSDMSSNVDNEQFR